MCFSQISWSENGRQMACSQAGNRQGWGWLIPWGVWRRWPQTSENLILTHTRKQPQTNVLCTPPPSCNCVAFHLQVYFGLSKVIYTVRLSVENCMWGFIRQKDLSHELGISPVFLLFNKVGISWLSKHSLGFEQNAGSDLGMDPGQSYLPCFFMKGKPFGAPSAAHGPLEISRRRDLVGRTNNKVPSSWLFCLSSCLRVSSGQ